MSVPTTSAKKTPAEKMREYRKRKREQQLLLMNERSPPVSNIKTPAERQREYWKRKREKQRLSTEEQPTTSTSKTPAERSQDYRNRQKIKRLTSGNENNEETSARKIQKLHLKFDKNLLKLERNKVASERCGDICAIESSINGQRTLIVTVYVNPNSNMADIKLFFLTNLLMYSPKASEMFEELRELGTIPIILSGDFNLDFTKEENKEFIDFMKDRFELQLKSDPKISTSRNGNCTDMIFARHLLK